jgi:hypothetical protein
MGLLFLPFTSLAVAQTNVRFEVSFSHSLRSEPLTGRLLVVVSRESTPEPRLKINQFRDTPPVFGIDLNQLAPDSAAVVDSSALGSPLKSLNDLPAGDYIVQAIVNVYTECHRSDGHTIWVPLDRDRLPLNVRPGNMYSDVQKIHVEPDANSTVKIGLTRIIPPVPDPNDTKWLKHVKIQSQLLTRFWGQPIYLGATILLPKGYETHPDVSYPAVYVHGHPVPFMFNDDPASQAKDAGLKEANLQTGYEFYQSWVSDGFPRFIGVTFQQPTPYFLDSYSINSANVGPYGDALTQELIPYLEKHFRIITQSYARLVEGASTGGWETLALQLHYPDYFGGAWIFNPDPIDFQRYQQINIYDDENAFSIPVGEWRSAERPMMRTTEGQVIDTVRYLSRNEEVLGSHGRSGYQLEAWEAVYGPVGADGYPKPLWDKLTGKIDHEVAAYMRDHGYDLRYYAESHWATLGPKLVGKLNFFSGEMDNYYLNLGVYRFEDFLKNTKGPHYEGRFEYGRPMKGHSWHLTDWAGMLREMAEYIRKNAPAGEDTSRWNN